MSNLRPDYEKIIQCINFFARKSNNTLTKINVLKLIFFADRYHMRMYGRMITNDCYFAMQYGPVASVAKSVFEFAAIPQHLEQYAMEYLRPSQKNDMSIKSVKEVDFDVFSETDIEALNAAWHLKESRKDLVKFSHRFPEWKNHENELKSFPRSQMNLLDFFLQAPAEAEYCLADDERVECNKEHFSETFALYAVL